MKIQTLTVDYLGSCTNACDLSKDVMVSDYIVAAEGYCIACEVVSSKDTYNQFECDDLAFHKLKPGDRVVGVLGERMALRGYSGHLPRHIEAGDTLHLVNMGGVISRSGSFHPDLGPPLELRVLGAVVRSEAGKLRHVCIQEHSISPQERLPKIPPVVMVSGTAMNSGKTKACGEIVKVLTAKGYRVAAAKLTGVSLMRDVQAMKAKGAVDCLTFTQAGIVSSVNKNIVPYAKGILAALGEGRPDVIVVELGDGVLGYYGVEDILADREINAATCAHVFAALDFMGAHAGMQIFENKFKSDVSVMVGPVTDNDVGRQYVEQVLGVPAINARSHGEELGSKVAEFIPLTKTRKLAKTS